MFLVLLTMLIMLAILGVAALVAVYLVFPRRGLEVPKVPWLGEALDRTVAALPTLPDPHADPHADPAGSRAARPSRIPAQQRRVGPQDHRVEQ